MTARTNKRQISGWFSPGLSTQLRKIAVEEGRTLQSVLGEALDMLLRDRGKAASHER